MARRLVSRRDIAIDVYETDEARVQVTGKLLDPYHLILLELEVDPATRTILRSEAQLPNHPHSLCPQVADRARGLEGKVIGRGILKEIKLAVGSGAGCIHLRELATEVINFTATCLIGYEQGYGLMSSEFNRLDENTRYQQGKNLLAGTCMVYRGGDAPGELAAD